MDAQSMSDHWGSGDIFALILEAMEAAGLAPDTMTVARMAPVDHFHARGFPATVELADALPILPGHHLVDIGCGLGGPARYLAERFGCRVSGIDITGPFVEAANKLTAFLGLEGQVDVQLGDGHHLPFGDAAFDGGYTQHVTMNVADRAQFYGEAFRVLKPGAFFALTEHGLGPQGDPHFPTPWSEDGSGSFLVTPADTVAHLQAAGFVEITVEDTGAKYASGYRRVLELAAQGALPPFSSQILLGATALDKTLNSARNIEERRTHPVQIICHKPE
ncbi:MAG: methyltransferase domain-containing protein [Rhodospirillaceae bacterium]|nr:methyltransferase domain-containing protein [Rhodospirillaceae bacterium]